MVSSLELSCNLFVVKEIRSFLWRKNYIEAPKNDKDILLNYKNLF